MSNPQGLGQKHILADFSGGAVTSNGGALLLGLADASLDLTRRLGQCFDDHRDPALVVHEVQSLVGQRIVGLALGYEDLNDHEELRKDPVVGAILGCLEPRRSDCEPLAGKSTLNRLELAAAGVNHQKQRKLAANFEQMDELLVKLLVEDYAAPPPQIVLDVDTTDYVVHGSQQQRFYRVRPQTVDSGFTRQPVAPRDRGVLETSSGSRVQSVSSSEMHT